MQHVCLPKAHNTCGPQDKREPNGKRILLGIQTSENFKNDKRHSK